MDSQKSSNIPLFRAPYLIWKELMENMGPIDLALLSMCSQKMEQAVSALAKRHYPYEIGVRFGKGQKCEISLSTYGSGESKIELNTTTLGEIHHCLKVIEQIWKIFRRTTTSAIFETGMDEFKRRVILDWASRNSRRFSHAALEGDTSTDDEVLHFLDVFKRCCILQLLAPTSPQFNWNLPFHLESLEIVDPGFKIENLWTMNCNSVYIFKSSFTAAKLKHFILKWKFGNEKLNVSTIRIEKSDFSMQRMLQGVPIAAHHELAGDDDEDDNIYGITNKENKMLVISESIDPFGHLINFNF
ncbi:hypothetical protein B9Z55_003098 [Caenorhabditis nigoni]|nr:hypothetical protein B9Z55_003098 [Caenorhabditis nigoni]